MKHSIYILMLAVASVLTTSCNTTKNPPATEETKLTFEPDTIRPNKLRGMVTSANPDAYFVSGIMDSDELEKNPTDEQIIRYQLDFMNELYDIYYSTFESSDRKGDKPDFNSIFLYQGTEIIDYQYLDPDTYYELLAFQVNPDTHEPIGKLCRYPFTTPHIDSSAVTFAFEVNKDTIRIIPSDDSPYIFAFEQRETIENDYILAEFFFYDMITFYEDYGFIETMRNKGVYDFILSNHSRDIEDDKDYILTIAGYNGDINTEYTYLTFHVTNNEFVVVITTE